MRETFLPFSKPSIQEWEISEVANVLRSGWITTGPKNAEFEKAFCAYTGAKHAIPMTSETSVMEVLFKSEAGLPSVMSALTAVTMLVFSLLYTPCVAAIAAIKRELGARWGLYVVLWQCGIAWVAALIVRLIGLALGLGE